MPNGTRNKTANGLVLPEGLGDEFDDVTNWQVVDQFITDQKAGGSGSVAVQDVGYDIVLLAGQSNMAGRCNVDSFADWIDGSVQQWGAYSSDAASYQKIGMLTEPMKGADTTLASGRTGPGPWFARTFAKKLASNRRLLIINTSIGGTTLVGGPWAVGGTHYSNSVTQANAAILAAQRLYPSSKFVGICWMQGESDGDAGVSTATYKAGLAAVIAGFRSAITGASNSWFVISGMVPEAISTRTGYPAIQAAHIAVAAETTSCVYVEGVSGYSSDNLHYTTRPGPQIVGFNLAQAAYELHKLATPSAPAAATAVSLTGPTTGTAGSASTAFTVVANGVLSGNVTVTPSSTLGGTFTPSSVTLAPGSTSATFTFTPSSAGSGTISISNNGGLTNSGTVAFTASAGASPATALTLTGPSSATVGSASSAFTVAANGTLSSNVTVTPSDGGAGGTFTPSTVTLTPASTSATFTYTPSSTGTKTITVTNSGSLSNPTSVSVIAAAAGGASNVFNFEADTVGSAPVGVTTSGGGAMSVVNSGVAAWTGKYLRGPAPASGTVTYTSDFTSLTPNSADQTLTWKRAKSAAGCRDGFMLRSQPGTSVTGGGNYDATTREGYLFQVSDQVGAYSLKIYKATAAAPTGFTSLNSFSMASIPSDALFRASAIGSALKFEYSTDSGTTWTTAINITDTTFSTGLGAVQHLAGFASASQNTVFLDDITLNS